MIKQSDSDISELSTEQLKKELIILKRENHAALLTIDRLLIDLNKKREQVEHLETLITKNVPVIKKENNKISVIISPEEEIAQVQLERLRQSSLNRTLTLEEVRTFDLLVKNKRLVLDESTVNMGKNKLRDVEEADLLQLAQTNLKITDDPDEE